MSSPTHAYDVLDWHARRVYLSRKSCRAVLANIREERAIWGIFQTHVEKKKGTSRRAMEVNELGEESASSFLAWVPCCAMYYRRSHVGAQQPIIVFPPGRSTGKPAWEWFYLEWITGRIVMVMAGFDVAVVMASHYVNYTRRCYCRDFSHLAPAWNLSSLLRLSLAIPEWEAPWDCDDADRFHHDKNCMPSLYFGFNLTISLRICCPNLIFRI